MNNRLDYTNEAVYQRSLKILDDLLEKLFVFLKDKSPVTIRNVDFVPCYDFAFYASSQDDKTAEKLFEYFKSKTKAYATELNNLMAQTRSNSITLIEEFVQAWDNAKIYIRWMMKIFNNLDKHHLHLRDTTTCHTGFKIFKETCFVPQAPRVIALIFDLLNKEREGEEIPSLLVIRALKNVYQIGSGKNIDLKINTDKQDSSRFYYTSNIDSRYYIEEFEKKLLETTRAYYEARSQQWLTWSVPEYVRQALLKLREEEDRAEKFYPSSKKVVIAVIEETIIVKHHKALASNENTGVNAMLAKNSKEELAQIFALFNRAFETLTEIVQRFGAFIESQGMSAINDPNVTKDPIEFTRKLFELKIEADSFVQKQFQAHLSFQRKRDLIFQIILNKFDKSPGYLASYLDFELKKGIKGNTEDEIEQKLNNAKSLIFLLNSRDAFLKIYSKQLSSRLLNGTTISNEAEKNMYNLMQAEWGQMTVKKIKSMLQDMEMSKEINTEFHKFKENNRITLPTEMNVTILTQGCWPESEAKKSIIPEEVEPCKTAFEKFYQHKYPGKILNWTLTLGDSEMVGNFDKKKFIFVVSNVQMSILLLFNKRKEMKYEEIKTLLGIPDADLEPNLLFLIIKNEILTKGNPSIKDKVYEDEVLTFNSGYSSQLKRVNCKPTRIAVAKKMEEVNNAEKDVIKEREFIIDATIIRIMKSRRILDYNSIQTETKKLITMFVPDPSMIKRRIESLCEREYMKRDEKEKNKFIYMP